MLVSNFPYQERFESSNGGWTTGGVANDWVWGTPSKSVISSAGEGLKSWVVGGLTGNSYSDAEASWLQTPCFDLSSLGHPYLEFMLFWEMEYQFDGASFQYSLDNGATWVTLGSFHDPVDCLNENWYNNDNITYLSPLSSNRAGWTGNIQATAGSCRGGNGSNGWVTAKKTLQALAGETSVVFRFVFGSGTICNNYNGFAIDNFRISEAPVNVADFSYTCNNKTVIFKNESALCPDSFSWDFGDPLSGASNQSTLEDPQHVYSGPGTYLVSLTINHPGNGSATISKQVTILDLEMSILKPAECLSGLGGSATVLVSGGTGPYNYSWNTNPAQVTATASNLGPFIYEVTVSSNDACATRATVQIPVDPSCTEVFFPSAFTPDQNGRNDRFGPIGNLGAMTEYKFGVYNRWGERIFYSVNPFEKWDGQFKGAKSDGHIYIWTAEFKFNGSPQSRKGTVVLIR